jgi:hypothetical protein
MNIRLGWQSTPPDQLALRVDFTGSEVVDRWHVAVPGAVIRAMQHTGTFDAASDPAMDLVRAEGHWRLQAAQLESSAGQIYHAVIQAFADRHAGPAAERPDQRGPRGP